MTEKQKRFAENWLIATDDPALIELRKPLAIVQERIKLLMQRVDLDASTSRWAKVIKLFNEFKKAHRIGDTFTFTTKIRELTTVMDGVEHDYESWNQIFDAFDLQRKLSESERKRLKELNQFLTYEDFMDTVGRLLTSVFEVLDDPVKLKKIYAIFAKETGSTYFPFDGRTTVPTGESRSSDVDREALLDTGNERADSSGGLPEEVLEGSFKQG